MDTKKMAQIFAIQAEIEGMKIENAEFAANGKLPPYPYGEGAFFRKAEQLRALAVDGCQPEAKATLVEFDKDYDPELFQFEKFLNSIKSENAEKLKKEGNSSENTQLGAAKDALEYLESAEPDNEIMAITGILNGRNIGWPGNELRVILAKHLMISAKDYLKNRIALLEQL